MSTGRRGAWNSWLGFGGEVSRVPLVRFLRTVPSRRPRLCSPAWSRAPHPRPREIHRHAEQDDAEAGPGVGGLEDEQVHKEAVKRMKTVPLDSDTVETARDLGICFGD